MCAARPARSRQGGFNMTTSAARATIDTSEARKVSTPSRPGGNLSRTSSQTSRGGTVKTVILDVGTRQEASEDFVRACETGRPQRNARISVETPELRWQVLTARRWELLKSLCGGGPSPYAKPLVGLAETLRPCTVMSPHCLMRAYLIEPRAVQSSFRMRQSKSSSCFKRRDDA